MVDPLAIIEKVAGGLITGGVSGLTTLLAVFKDMKKRVTDLEVKVGSNQPDARTGIFFQLETISDTLRRLKRDIDSWHDEVPDWLTRAMSRQRTGSINLEHQHDFEERVDSRFRGVIERMKRLEEDLDEREQHLEDKIQKSSPDFGGTFITRDEYVNDSKQRAAELAKIRENLVAANAGLRGVMAALGYLETKPTPPPFAAPIPRPPPVPPRKPPKP